MSEVIKYGVMTVPAMVIDEVVVSSGKLLRNKEIETILTTNEIIIDRCGSDCNCSCDSNGGC